MSPSYCDVFGVFLGNLYRAFTFIGEVVAVVFMSQFFYTLQFHRSARHVVSSGERTNMY